MLLLFILFLPLAVAQAEEPVASDTPRQDEARQSLESNSLPPFRELAGKLYKTTGIASFFSTHPFHWNEGPGRALMIAVGGLLLF